MLDQEEYTCDECGRVMPDDDDRCGYCECYNGDGHEGDEGCESCPHASWCGGYSEYTEREDAERWQEMFGGLGVFARSL